MGGGVESCNEDNPKRLFGQLLVTVTITRTGSDSRSIILLQETIYKTMGTFV